MVRGDFHGSLIAGHGFVELSLLPENRAKIAVRRGVIWSEFQGTPETRCRFVELSLLFQYDAKIVVRFHAVRPQLQGPLVAGFRLVEPVQGPIGFTQVGVKAGIVRIRFNGAANAVNRGLVPALLMGDQPEKMPCVRVIRLGFENLTVDLLRSLKLTSPMVLNSPR